MTPAKLISGASTAALLLLLTGCGGSSNSASSEPVPAKKMLHAENLDQGLATYLLMRYRLYQELAQLTDYMQLHKADLSSLQNCPLQGTVSHAGPAGMGSYDFDRCQTSSGTINTGSIELHLAIGAAKTSWYTFNKLNYQLAEDSQALSLTGNYYWPGQSKKFDYYDLAYTAGTQTTRYQLSDMQKPAIEISTSAISGNQHFIVTERDSQAQAITPVLRADDGSNISITIDANGQASIALRNEAEGKILLTKIYTKAEVSALLSTARRVKS